jgi:hypothetical protein
MLNQDNKWSDLCTHLPGRTYNAIKNRANLLLNKDFKKINSKSEKYKVYELV